MKKAFAFCLIILLNLSLTAAENMETATFGAGCFWGVEDTFMQLDGVIKTTVGYLGGNLKNPSYKDVCTGATGHAEVVQIEFDPEIISYQELLDVFWKMHNPTSLNKQGPDIGTQYRSAIFYHSEAQKRMAEQSKSDLNAKGVYNRPIVTEITKTSTFYKAEDYHQKYLQKNGLSSCHL